MTVRAVLTDPRKEALSLLAEYHYLTTPNFYRLLGSADSQINRNKWVL